MVFMGDTHGLRSVMVTMAKMQLYDKNIIHVGDFGLGFQEIGRDIMNLMDLDEALLEQNNHLYVIRGNHDNPIFWDRSKGLILPKFHNIHFMDDYTVKRIEDKNILFVGGAMSIDRSVREDDYPHPTWWVDEKFKYSTKKLESALNSCSGNLDIVVTHTAPSFCYPTNDDVEIVNHYHMLEKAHGRDLKAELRAERKEVDYLHYHINYNLGHKPKHWLYGHFHASRKHLIDGIEFKLLNINEVYVI